MSLTDNIQDVAFTSEYNIDKVVGVWEGNFDKATDTETRTGGIGSIYVYKIVHGQDRPVFTDLLWSEDGNNWVDGGSSLSGGNTSISFSDSENIYIVASSASGTQWFKIIAFWINEYDSTNPLVEAVTPDIKDRLLDGDDNYQKILLDVSSTYSPGTFSTPETVSIPHSLGYIPNAKAYFEPFSGEVWPLNAGGISNYFLYDFAQDEAYMKIYSDRVDVEVNKYSNDTRKVWVKVYLDA